MPLYIYRRSDGTTTERLESVHQTPLTECPDTGLKMGRIMAGGQHVRFVGEGFYINDYPKDGPMRRTRTQSKASW